MRKDTGKCENHVSVDDTFDDDMYDEPTTPADDTSSITQTIQTSVSQTSLTDVPLRRSKRTIRKPIRYSDPHY